MLDKIKGIDSVDSIIKSFTKTIENLKKLVDRKELEVVDITYSIEEMHRIGDNATLEINKAKKIIEKLEDLLN